MQQAVHTGMMARPNLGGSVTARGLYQQQLQPMVAQGQQQMAPYPPQQQQTFPDPEMRQWTAINTPNVAATHYGDAEQGEDMSVHHGNFFNQTDQ